MVIIAHIVSSILISTTCIKSVVTSIIFAMKL